MCSPSSGEACAADLRDALILVRRAQGGNYTSWASVEPDPTPPLIAYSEEDLWEPGLDDPYWDEEVPYELTELGARAALGPVT